MSKHTLDLPLPRVIRNVYALGLLILDTKYNTLPIVRKPVSKVHPDGLETLYGYHATRLGKGGDTTYRYNGGRLLILSKMAIGILERRIRSICERATVDVCISRTALYAIEFTIYVPQDVNTFNEQFKYLLLRHFPVINTVHLRGDIDTSDAVYVYRASYL